MDYSVEEFDDEQELEEEDNESSLISNEFWEEFGSLKAKERQKLPKISHGLQSNQFTGKTPLP